MKVVLINPEIPQNTGNIGRTCVANDIELILVGRLGFELTDKALKRAGLDYWKHLKLCVHKNFEDFLKTVSDKNNLIFFSTKGKKTLWEAPFNLDSYLIFGNESSGFPKDFYLRFEKQLYRIPMSSKNIRSLNLATSVGICVYHAIYRIQKQP